MKKLVLDRWRLVWLLGACSAILSVFVALTNPPKLLAQDAKTASTPAAALMENKPWTADFNEMAKMRQIRALVTYSKTFYFFDRGRQRGISHDLLKEFEKFINKMLLAFASYNAGPAKVRQLRKKTADMGLNPNIWFDNVEVAAAKVIGRETVQYVSNIYKYYIAYRMVTEQRERKQKLMKEKSG